MAKEREADSTHAATAETRGAAQEFIAGLGNQFGNISSKLAEVGQSNPDLEPGGAASFKALEHMGRTIQNQIVDGAKAASGETLASLRADLERHSIKEMLASADGLVDIAANQAQQAGLARLSFWDIVKCVAEALKCIATELPFIGDRLIRIFCCLIDLICCLSGGSRADNTFYG